MTGAIFRDDSSPADKRAAALEKLMELCPRPYRVTMRGFVESALESASIETVEGLLIDVDVVRDSAGRGDFSGIATIAKKYGASDEAIAQFLPMLSEATPR